jgi:hypothetical protein
MALARVYALHIEKFTRAKAHAYHLYPITTTNITLQTNPATVYAGNK